MNEQFRQHVTSTAFSLTLSKAMIRFLVRQDLIREAGYCTKDLQPRPHRQSAPDNFIATGHALEGRGLIAWHPRLESAYKNGRPLPRIARLCAKHGLSPEQFYLVQDPRIITITKAGHLVISLLKEAGLYEQFAKDIRPLEAAA